MSSDFTNTIKDALKVFHLIHTELDFQLDWQVGVGKTQLCIQTKQYERMACCVSWDQIFKDHAESLLSYSQGRRKRVMKKPTELSHVLRASSGIHQPKDLCEL